MSYLYASTDEPERIEASRRSPVRIAGLFLGLQGVAALVVATRLGLERDWSRVFEGFTHPSQLPAALPTAAALVIFALLAFASALGFVLFRRGWLLAMILQAVMLGVTLASHMANGPGSMYLLMAYSVFMVFYVNSRPVRATLHGDPGGPEVA